MFPISPLQAYQNICFVFDVLELALTLLEGEICTHWGHMGSLTKLC